MSNVTDIKTGLPVVAGVEIAVDEQGRFNLNAIHKASETGAGKKPSEWLRTKQAQELAAELEAEIPAFKILETVKGRGKTGTFAHELLAISYAGWISPAFQLRVNQVFMDYRTGRVVLPDFSNPAEAARAWADQHEKTLKLEQERNEAQRTKAWIGSKREATAMAKASAATRKANELERRLGQEENWKRVKAIPWLAEEFAITRTMYQQVGKKLKAISDELGLEIDKSPDSEYGEVKIYHIDAINELWRRLQEDSELLAKYRKEKAA
jgi:chemotaxis protein histidine kinase CheA